MSDLAPHMEAVARALWGEPNAALSTALDVRWGSHGSRSVDRRKGTWYDHEAEEGGGVLDLLRRDAKLSNGAAFQWMRDRGFAVEPPPAASSAARSDTGRRVLATYDYVSEDGELLYQVVRFEPKDFRQRRPDPSARDGWVWSVKNCRLVPYRLPELIDDLAHERTIFIVEGEKAVDFLRTMGIAATCNPMGAKKWPPEFASFFKGADVVIARDNNDVGREHGNIVGQNIAPVASSVRVLDPPGVREKEGLDDWIQSNKADVDGLFRLVEAEAFRFGEEPFRSRYRALWLHEIKGVVPKFRWIVKSLIPENAFGSFVGEPGCGKSFLALDLGFHIGVLAREEGTRWFGRRVNHGGVVYVAPEGQQGFIKRVHALLQRHKISDGERIPFVLFPSGVDLRSPEGDTAPLIAEIKVHGARMDVPLSVVFIDTLNRALAGGDENSSEDMGAFIANCEKLRAETGATVIPVHHMNAGGTRERGHSSFRGALDFKIDVERSVEGGNLFRVTKQKDEEDGSSFAFALRCVTVGVDDDGDAMTSCVVESTDQSTNAVRKPGKKLPDSAVVAYRELIACCGDQGRRVPVAGLNASGVKLEILGEWMKRNQAPGTTDDAFRKGFSRALDTLRAAGRIGVHDGWAWPILSKWD